jgi:type IV pilus assembly protein PilA
MKTRLNTRLIQSLVLKNRTKGFTLIELLVVVIVIGVLSAVALPTLVNQVGKARETEAKATLGVMSRGQQAYHYEHKEFYDGAGANDTIGFNPTGKFYRYTANSSTDNDIALHTAYAHAPDQSHVRDFAAGVYFNAPDYSQTICIADGVDTDGTASSVSANTTGGCVDGEKIE